MASTELQVGGLVLCGGQSRRMGSDKSWLMIGHEHLLSRVVRVMQSATDPVVVAGRRDQLFPPLPDGVVHSYDAMEDGGPLAGMVAGFEKLAGQCEAVFVVSCDQPLIHPDFVQRMISLLGDDEAVVVEHDGHLHSLTALYRMDVLATMKKLIEQGVRSAHRLIKACDARVLSLNEFGYADVALRSLRNVNDQMDYAALMNEFQS